MKIVLLPLKMLIFELFLQVFFVCCAALVALSVAGKVKEEEEVRKVCFFYEIFNIKD